MRNDHPEGFEKYGNINSMGYTINTKLLRKNIEERTGSSRHAAVR